MTPSLPASAGGGNQTSSTGVTALGPVLSGIAAGGGAIGSTPSLPSLPLSSGGGSAPTVPSLPVTTPGGSLPAPPSVGTPSAPTSGGPSTVNVPLPALPVPVNPPSISVGISTGSSNPGRTLGLP